MSVFETDTLAARSLERVHDTAGAIADDVKSEAKGKLRDVVDLASEAYEEGRARAFGVVDSADSFLRGRALMTIGIVAGAALLLGFALRGRPSRPAPPALAVPGGH
jgi:ElaB/YqjD/DUF883 family membrane-anchored ribosome-binding protein